MLIGLIIGTIIRFGLSSILSVGAYNKGYKDGERVGKWM